MSKQNRYPGPQPFTEAQANVFFGREASAQSLYQMIGQENLVVVHAKSGVGKSSLLKAGLLPILRGKGGFLPLEIRLNAAGSDGVVAPAETVRINVENTRQEPSPAFLGEILAEDKTIWRSLKELQLTQLAKLEEGKDPPTILLIFDQFEELFTYPPAQQLAFRRQLAEALHTRLPQRYWDMLSLYEGDDAPFTDREKQHLLRGLRVHVVTAIREDRMHLLGSLADYLPTISKNWFELKHLNRGEATRAIEAPAAHTGDFATAPFAYEPTARDAIIAYLSEGEGGIESTQLQVICDALDRRLAGKPERTVTPTLMGDLKLITAQFYQDKLAEIEDPDQRLIARKLVENELIYAQARRRLSLFSGQIFDYGVSPETLKVLVDRHLLRAEPDLRGGYNYEVSHDSLVAPILKARGERELEEAELERRRIAREAAVERERVAEEQARKLATERARGKRVRQQNRLLIALLVVAALAIVAAVVSGYNARESLKKFEEEEKAREEAEMARNVSDGRRFLEDADIFLISGDTALAWAKVDTLKKLKLPVFEDEISVLENKIPAKYKQK